MASSFVCSLRMRCSRETMMVAGCTVSQSWEILQLSLRVEEQPCREVGRESCNNLRCGVHLRTSNSLIS